MHFSVVFHMEIQVKIIRFLFFSGLYYDFIVIYTYFSHIAALSTTTDVVTN